MGQSTQTLEGIAVQDGVARLPGSPALEVTLRRSRRARRLSLRVSGLDGRATLTIPPRFPQAQALGFLNERAAWLRKALDRVQAPAPVRPGGTLLYRGNLLELREAEGQRIRLAGDSLLVPPDPSGTRTGPRLETFLKADARAALLPAVERYTTALGRRAKAVTLRDTRSRWGSCTSQGRLMFSWRLIMAPPDVLDYVVAHEVAHLAHMDHSRAFWDCVGHLMPDYTAHRNWLRSYGAQLHSYSFKARSAAESG